MALNFVFNNSFKGNKTEFLYLFSLWLNAIINTIYLPDLFNYSFAISPKISSENKSKFVLI